MATTKQPEVWLRGPLPGTDPLLQPVAHALLQAREEVTELLQDFNDKFLWERPAGLAAPGFHLQHLTGVLDRLFTYARNESLTDTQLLALRAEGSPPAQGTTARELVRLFAEQVDRALQQLEGTPVEEITQFRPVGRAGLPSTVLGLLVHAAEHTMRHLGQLLVTVGVLQAGKDLLPKAGA